MQRHLLSVLVVACVAAIVLSQRPHLVGDLIALAGTLEGSPWSDPAASPPPPGWAPSRAGQPQRPSATARQATRPAGVPSTEVQVGDLEPFPGPGPGSFPPIGPAEGFGESPQYRSGGLPVIDDRQPTPKWGPDRYPQTPFDDETPVGIPAGPGPWPSAGPTERPRPQPGRPPESTLERPLLSDAPIQAGPLPTERLIPCEGSEVVARVGGEVILAREVSMGIAELREQNKDRMPPEALDAEIKKVMQKQLESRVEQKLLYLDARRKAPAEGFKKVQEMIAKDFENKQIPGLMKDMKAGSRRELEEKLRRLGVTLEMRKRGFIEAVLAYQWLREQVKPNEDLGHGEMLSYYREHIAEYEQPGRVRWEQLMVRKGLNPREAYDKLCWMGNQALDGAPLAEVARKYSDGPTASRGGARDWTGQGSLVSKPLDKAIFSASLSAGNLSRIIEDEQGFHIVRVVERQDSVRKPFLEAQVEIREKIRAQRDSDAKLAFLARLRKETPVWSAFETRSEIASPSGLRVFQ